ncbi:MAG: hypothetical protein P8Y54_08850 [Xanthomonadales bacterium]
MQRMQARFVTRVLDPLFPAKAVRKAFWRSSKIALVALLLIFSTQALAQTECSDGIDNDNDGFIDLQDFNCVDSNDDTESPTQCSDGIDNDNDGFVDLDDFNCVDSEDATESPTQCSDGIDNDNDGFVDLDDFDCDGPEDTTERSTAVVAPVEATPVPTLSMPGLIILTFLMAGLAAIRYRG